jgi:hypothetical protein
MTPRDLSGFRAESPHRAVDVAPPPSAPPPSPVRDGARTADRPRKVRSTPASGRTAPDSITAGITGRAGRAPRRKVMVALAADLHRRLRAQAEAQGVFKADVVVDAYDHYAEALRREHHAASAGLHPRARRRRSVEDATQCQLYLTDEERGRIDNLAMEIGLSRSELASRLLERALSPASS